MWLMRAWCAGRAAASLRTRCGGHLFREPSRHGKYLVVPVTGLDAAVLMHFGVKGSLRWATDDNRHRHDRVVFVFADGSCVSGTCASCRGCDMPRTAKPLRYVHSASPVKYARYSWRRDTTIGPTKRCRSSATSSAACPRSDRLSMLAPNFDTWISVAPAHLFTHLNQRERMVADENLQARNSRGFLYL
jgi:hypothetical protein